MKILKKKIELIDTNIGSISKISSGSTPRRDTEIYWNSKDIPWMTSGEVHSRFLYDTENYISVSGWKSIGNKIFPKNTIMMALAGQGKTKGNVCFLEKEVSSNQSLAGIVVDSKNNDPLYIYYILSNMYKEIRNIVGEGREGINIQNIKDIKIRLPKDIESQKKVSIFLREFEKYKKTIKELLRKIEIRNKYYIDKLLNGELTVQNEKTVENNIPLNKTLITELFDLKMGETILKNQIEEHKINDNCIPVYSATEENKIFGYIDKNKVKKILCENDMILAARGSIGSLKLTDGIKTSTQTTIQLIAKTKYSSYLALKYLENNRSVIFKPQGAAIPQITIDGIKSIEINLINNKEVETFLRKIDKEKEKVEKLLKLEEQRFEWLSDKLLSGEYIIED